MNISQRSYDLVKLSWWILKITYGLFFIIAGADKFFYLLVYWPAYVSPVLFNLFSSNAQQFLWGVGIIEIVIGCTVLWISTQMGAYIAMGWAFLVVVNLLSFMTRYDVIVRDVIIALGALVLGLLTEALQASKE